ncbi:MAG: hypothetical protein ACWGPN_06925 [Gammaproteobacteria bacterium]
MRASRYLVILGLLTVGAAAQEVDYRVSGTIVGAGGKSLAMIERTPGGSVTVTPGDEIDGASVVEIDQRYVRLRFPDQDLLVPLNGAPAEAVPRSVLSPTQPVDPYTRHVDGSEFLRAIDEISGRLAGRGAAVSGDVGDVGAGTARERTVARQTRSDAEQLGDNEREDASDSGGDPGQALADVLRGTLDIPPGVAIRNINGEPFSSVEQGLGIMERFVAQEAIVRFETYTDTEPSRPLYLFPE